jgi:hypothetical protein
LVGEDFDLRRVAAGDGGVDGARLFGSPVRKRSTSFAVPGLEELLRVESGEDAGSARARVVTRWGRERQGAARGSERVQLVRSRALTFSWKTLAPTKACD